MKNLIKKSIALFVVICLFQFAIPADICTTCYQEQTHYAPKGFGYWVEISSWCSPAGLSAPCGRNNYCHCFKGGWYNECVAKFCQPGSDCQAEVILN
jgi:hypothetical protein